MAEQRHEKFTFQIDGREFFFPLPRQVENRDLSLTVEGVRQAVLDIVERRQQLTQDATLTPLGQHEQLRAFVQRSVLPRLERFEKTAVGPRRGTWKARSAKLQPFDEPEPGDAVSELRAQELRRYVRELPDQERSNYVLHKASEQVRAAVAAQLPEISGVTEEIHATLRQRALDARHGEEIERLRREDEQLAMAERALTQARRVVEHVMRAAPTAQPAPPTAPLTPGQGVRASIGMGGAPGPDGAGPKAA